MHFLGILVDVVCWAPVNFIVSPCIKCISWCEKNIVMFVLVFHIYLFILPISLAARSEVWVCGRSLAGIEDSNPAGGLDVCCE
jgi:hypothetical protein